MIRKNLSRHPEEAKSFVIVGEGGKPMGGSALEGGKKDSSLEKSAQQRGGGSLRGRKRS